MAEAVVDSSVVAAIVFGIPEIKEALALTRGLRVVAPELIRYEIANNAVTKIRRGTGTSEEVSARFGKFGLLGVQIIPLGRMEFPRILDLAVEEKLTSYDAAYLWISMTRHLTLVTFDRQLAAAAARRLTPRV
jgi:predicted nucleic acid-binding protein